MGNSPAGDFARLTHISALQYAGQFNFNHIDVGYRATSSEGKGADYAPSRAAMPSGNRSRKGGA